MDDAIIKLMEESVLPYLRKFDSQAFRFSKLYKKNCDNILKNNLLTLKDIYKRASSLDAIPGEDSLMSLNEFTNLI